MNCQDITFVVCGIVCQTTSLCIKSIKRNFPESKIILSTWIDSDISSIEVDKVLYCRDPGDYEIDTSGVNANLYRMLDSVAIGMSHVETSHAVRIRTDFYFRNRNLLKLKLEPVQSKNFKVFNKRIIALNLYFRNPSFYPCLYHIGDMFHYGLTSDLKKLWSLDRIDQELIIKNKKFIFDLDRNLRYRYHNEQYLWVKLLRKSDFFCNLKYQTDLNYKDYNISQSTIAQNFDIYDANVLGLVIPDRFCSLDQTLYTQDDLVRLRNFQSSGFHFLSRLPHNLKKLRRAIKNLFKYAI